MSEDVHGIYRESSLGSIMTGIKFSRGFELILAVHTCKRDTPGCNVRRIRAAFFAFNK